MKDCPYEIDCSRVALDLALLGIDLTCDTCIDVFAALANKGGYTATKILDKLGLTSATMLAAHGERHIWKNATCVHTDMCPVGLCQQTACLAWVDYRYTGNCFRVFLGDQNATIRDIACVLNIPETDASRLVDRGRSAVAWEYLGDDAPLVYPLVRNAETCVCGNEAVFVTSGWGYCSKDCETDTPPLYRDIECRFGKKLDNVLQDLLRYNKRIIPLILGVDGSECSKLYQRIGISLLKTTLTKKARPSNAFKGRWASIRNFCLSYYEENGSPTLNGKKLRSQIDTILEDTEI